MTETTELSCRCGRVHLRLDKTPIIVAECHCNSCRTAGAKLQTLPGTRSILEDNGGTQFVLYRKDRVHFTKGAELMAEFRLSPTASTRRVVASCCNTPLFAEFEHGHWLSLYGHLWPKGDMPAIELRTMTSDRTDGSQLDGNIPSGKRATAGFYARLLGAWIAMGFKSPEMAVDKVVAL